MSHYPAGPPQQSQPYAPYNSQLRIPASQLSMPGTLPPLDSKLALAKQAASSQNVFLCAGVVLLAMLCIVPIWNAAMLLDDFNYVFWHGKTVPLWMIGICCGTILIYIAAILAFFSYSRPQMQTEQTIMMIANIFITLLGLSFLLISLPVSKQAIDTYNNLMHRCDYSEETHRLFEYSQVLHNIRRTPDCSSKYSVEDCVGYEDAAPYTSFLKVLEQDFRCSGFCYRPSAKAILLDKSNHTIGRHQHRHDAGHLSADRELHDSEQLDATAKASYPPTLFSDANYMVSCDGMAARDMKNFAGDIGFQTFYQGTYLVLIAIATGFLKLIGFCTRRDRYENKARGAAGF